ncbi:hypothetical protein [Dactylosporangium matsuzakiense]|uniref:hypothetical protein n=1 Tax=Dactylosporangium matsuzakiense TaxID=53360 RepID=UPI0034D980CB
MHSRYRRRLADLAIAGRRVLMRLVVRRFFCTDASCDRKIYAEQSGLAPRYARRTSSPAASWRPSRWPWAAGRARG